MKKALSMILCLLFLFSPAFAEIQLTQSPTEYESKIAATENNSISAFFSPIDSNIYYLTKASSGYKVDLFTDGDYKTVYTLPEGRAYSSISADQNGNIYILFQNQDETAKSGIICLMNDDSEYVFIDYAFPGASSELVPYKMEFSPFSSSGYVLMWLNYQGSYIPVICLMSEFWGGLVGYDEFLFIIPGMLSAEIYPMSQFFDVYGYLSEGAQTSIDEILSEAILTPSDASLSPSGDVVLMTVPFEGETFLYAMDVISYALQIIETPDGFSGKAGWNADDTILLTDDSGYTEIITLDEFMSDDWSSEWDWSFEEDSEWSDDEDWNQVDESELNDWSW